MYLPTVCSGVCVCLYWFGSRSRGSRFLGCFLKGVTHFPDRPVPVLVKQESKPVYYVVKPESQPSLAQHGTGNHGRNIIAARNAGGKSTQGARETRKREPRHSSAEGSADTALIWDGNGRLAPTHFLFLLRPVTITTRCVLLGTASRGQFACFGPRKYRR